MNSVFTPLYPRPTSVLSPAVVRLLFDCCPIVVRLMNGQQSNNKCTSIGHEQALILRDIGGGVCLYWNTLLIGYEFF